MPKRRANGEGNIRKRKDGRWEGRYTVGHDPETGKAIIKNVLGKTQAEVKEKLKKAIEENVGIDYGRAKTYTVGNWLEVWYENYAKIKMRPSTYLTYHGYIENHIKPQLGKIPLNDLTTLHLQQFYKKLLAEGRVERIEAQKQPKGLSAKTVRNIHQIISSALKLAVEQRLIAHNPADGCALPKAERKEMQTLPVEQLTSFLREAKDSGVFTLYYIDLTTGLRRGELLGLKWLDIDLEKGDLRVRRQIGRINGKIMDSAIIGVLCYIGCSIFKFPSALLVSVIIGVTNVIPFFGPFIGAIPATLLILIQDPIKALWFVLFVLVLQQLDGNIIGPKILGNTTGLSSFWVLFAILLFGGLWGFVGMIIGVPLFAVIYDVIKKLVFHGLNRNDESGMVNLYHDAFGDPDDE